MISPEDEMILRTQEIGDKVKLIAEYLHKIMPGEYAEVFMLKFIALTEEAAERRRQMND